MKVSYEQTNFLGGEWSPFFQGRAEHPKYRSAMNTCLNGFPIEEGAWVRRPGSRLLAPTFKGQAAKLYPFHFTLDAPYQAEFTDGALRFFNNSWPVITPEVPTLASISTATPAVVALTAPVSWLTDDEIGFVFNPTMVAGSVALLLRQRTFLITMIPETYDAWDSTVTYGSGSLVQYTIVYPTWDSATTYNQGDKVLASGVSYIALRGTNLNNTPSDAAAAWSGATTYGIGDVVSDSGDNYISLVDSNLNIDPTVAGQTSWIKTPLVNQWWQAIATPTSQKYISLQANNINKEPDNNAAWWAPVDNAASRKFSIRDAVTGVDFDGSTVDVSNPFGVVVLRTLRLTTPYTAGSWANARIIQNEDVALVVNGTHIPQALSVIQNLGSSQAATATLKDVIFHDGPYLDPIANSEATVGGLSGVVEVTVAFKSWDNTKTYAIGDYTSSGAYAYKSLVDGNLNHDPTTDGGTNWAIADLGLAVTGPGYAGAFAGFQSTDVGRLMRFLSEPPLWNNGNYVLGDIVSYNDVVYKATANNSAVQPDTDPTVWAVFPSGAIWTWGKISTIINTNTVQVQILGDPLLYNSPVRTWRLGVYSDTTGWPTCGLFYEGRFYLGGAMPNRFDTSEVNGITADGVLSMAPTLPDGTVTDANAISYSFEADDKNPIFWFALDHHGIIAGTKGGEWLISASQLNDPLTPTSTQAHRVTRYRCADIEPRRTGISLVFVQSFKRRVMEFLADVFTGRFVAPHLTEMAKHLTQDGVEEIGYQEELAPLLWARTSTGNLIGATYRRTSMMTTEAPQIIGWHRQNLGTGRILESISVGPSNNGSLDALAFVTNNATAATADQVRYVEQLTTMYDEQDIIFDAWFLDAGIVPDSMYNDTVADVAGMRFTGLWYKKGETVTVFAGGLDVGDFTVDSNGTVFVPFGSGVDPGKYDYTAPGAGAWKFTQAWVDAVIAMKLPLRNGGIFIGNTKVTSTTITVNPNITSKVQVLTPVETVRTDQAIVDWANGRIAFDQSGNVGISVLSLINGTEIIQNTVAAITGNVGDGWNNNGIAGIDSGGNLYFCTGSVTNYQALAKVNDLTLALLFEAGSSSTFGPPATQGVAFPGSMAVAEANGKWVINVSTTKAITFVAGADGTFIAGNGSTDSGYMGVGGAPWQFETGGGIIAPGAATHEGNVAAAYVVENGNGWPATMSFFCVGVADGVPTAEANLENDGSTGKKGKGKKGAQNGGVIHVPSIDDPLVLFAKIGDLPSTSVDRNWTPGFNGWNGIVIDQLDNSIMTVVTMKTDTLLAWDNVTAYAVNDVITRGGLVYVAKAANTNVDPTTDTAGSQFPALGTNWNQVPTTYLISVNSGLFNRHNNGTFGLIWQVPLNFSPNLQNMMAQGRVRGGLLGLISNVPDTNGQTQIWLIDTTTGKFYVGDQPGITVGIVPHAWDDLSQSFIVVGDYDDTVTNTPIGLNGTTTFSGQWMRYYVGNLSPSSSIRSTLGTQPNGYTFVYTDFNGGNFPCVVGSTYTSQGQLLRAIAPEQAGTRNGPALGKIRRSNLYAVLLQSSLGIQIGTEFSAKGLKTPSFKDDDTKIANGPISPFSGIWRQPLEDRYSFDSMFAWQILRPYPTSVVAVSVFTDGTDA